MEGRNTTSNEISQIELSSLQKNSESKSDGFINLFLDPEIPLLLKKSSPELEKEWDRLILSLKQQLGKSLRITKEFLTADLAFFSIKTLENLETKKYSTLTSIQIIAFGNNPTLSKSTSTSILKTLYSYHYLNSHDANLISEELTHTVLTCLEEIVQTKEISSLQKDIKIKTAAYHKIHSQLEKRLNRRAAILKVSERTLTEQRDRFRLINSLITNLNHSESLSEILHSLTSINKILHFNRIGFIRKKTQENKLSLIIQKPGGDQIKKEYIYQEDSGKKIGPKEKFSNTLLYQKSSSTSFLSPLGNDLESAILSPIYSREDVEIYLVIEKEELLPFSEKEILDLKEILEPISLGIEKIILTEKINKTVKRWQNTFDAIQDPLIVVNQDYQILAANQAARSIKKSKRVLNSKCFKSLAGRNSPCLECPIINNVQNSKVIFESENKYEEEFLVQSYATQSNNSLNKGYVVFYRNISIERDLYSRVIQNEKMAAFGYLANSLAHEINNPLGGILAYTQLLKEELQSMKKTPLTKEIAEDLLEIENASHRCREIMNNLMGYSQVKNEFNDEDSEVNKKINITELIEATLVLSKSTLKNIKIEKNYSKVGEIYGNFGELQQVVFNLITNASHAMVAGGILTIKTKEVAENAVISIKDTGTGIKKSDLKKIFDPFFTTKSKIGTGLGLSVAFRIIQKHNGEISVSSKIGCGTEFQIKIPLFQKA